ncbi:WD repeat-containing protein DWA2-like isoform X1 [Camellia sinensis]|uniref:WD repeat-containing protein DWA2-like isoform X1 n=1 Tax=Camellia sinensis TaxID=4442 RepID=UPI0010358145|nr:WD repeat-containing protein DWA2-like isoform X1 [Camellia sinensis]
MQGGSTGIGYGLKYQARCIVDVKADTDHTSFIAGTLSLKEENEVHLIRLSSDGTELVCEGLFSHPNEIWDLSSCPFDRRILSTVFSSSGESYGAAIWQIPELYGQLNSSQLECICSLDAHNSKIKWYNHRSQLECFMKENSIEHTHVHNVDYDTKRKNILVTAEDESGIHVWDLRMPNVPILELPGHAHWTWAVRCNPEYDGLILTAGTDSTVNVWLTSPPSSDDITYESLVKSPTRLADPLLNSYSDYEDSVYGLSWSSREPWIFASLSYDGRVVVETIKPHLPKR